MRMTLSKGLSWLVTYTYKFECGTWRDQKNFNSIFPGEAITSTSKGHQKQFDPVIIELDLNDTA